MSNLVYVLPLFFAIGARAEAEFQEEFFAIGASSLGICVALVFVVLVGHVLHIKHISWFPECLVAMGIGAIAGILLIATQEEEEVENLKFSPSIFFFALLPPIILQAGYSLRRKLFVQNVGTIMLLAVLGTIFVTVSFGVVIWWLSDWCDVEISLMDSLLYGTVISATESVAILALLGNKELGADELLHALVFGESVFNDAVSIVLFDTLYGYHGGEKTMGGSEIAQVTGLFIGVSIGSFVEGVAIGLLCSLLMKNIDLYDNPAHECLLVFIAAFSSYCLAEIWHLSGVMALFFCGVTLAHYNWYNISKVSRASTRFGFEALAFGAETFVFIYLGYTLSVSFHPSASLEWRPKLILVAIIMVFLSRVYVFPFVAIANCFRSKREQITINLQSAIWFSAMRGAVAFALALNFPGEEELRGILVTTTLSVCLFTLFFCGVCMESVVKGLGLTNAGKNTEGLLTEGGDSIDLANLDGDARDSDIYHDKPSRSCLARLKHFDNQYMKKIFGGNLEDRTYRGETTYGTTIGSAYTQNFRGGLI